MAEERLRIARDVHDVVGHSLAVISLQAGVAEHLLGTNPDEARKAIGAIRGVSREALTDLRHEIALLRGQGADADGLVVSRLGELATLVESMRDAGMHVELSLDVDERPFPELVTTTVYRIAQEALTNVVRHAGSKSRARVAVAIRNERLELEVVDDGPGSTDTNRGAGIEGMKERALAVGGEFAAGNRPEGGFRVSASIPVRTR
jgi:signal transduction histidine kinase